MRMHGADFSTVVRYKFSTAHGICVVGLYGTYGDTVVRYEFNHIDKLYVQRLYERRIRCLGTVSASEFADERTSTLLHVLELRFEHG